MATLTAIASGGNLGNYTYTWSDNLGNTYPSTQQISVSPDTTLVFHVVADDGFNQVEAYYELLVFPSATFDWTGGQEEIMACPYDSIVLRPEPNPTTWSYLWSNGSVADHITVGATGIGYSQQTYSLTATTPDGCNFSKSAQVIFDFSYCFGVNETSNGILCSEYYQIPVMVDSLLNWIIQNNLQDSRFTARFSERFTKKISSFMIIP